jgi:hypothetical protein
MANKTKIFISYDYDNDKHYKNLLLAWDQNRQFDFYMSDLSADVSINSDKAGTVKSVLSRYINDATTLLVIVGKKTHKSDWVNWEIKKAVELKKRIIAVKTDRENTTPTELYGVGASWALSFTLSSITTAIDNS